MRRIASPIHSSLGKMSTYFLPIQDERDEHAMSTQDWQKHPLVARGPHPDIQYDKAGLRDILSCNAINKGSEKYAPQTRAFVQKKHCVVTGPGNSASLRRLKLRTSSG